MARPPVFEQLAQTIPVILLTNMQPRRLTDSHRGRAIRAVVLN